MSEQKHTPGPWKADSKDWLKHSCCWDMPITGYVNGKRVTVAETNFANARLIAAAPDMLAALQRAAPILSKVGQKDDEAWGAFSEVINAVIKALGGQT